MDIVNIVKLVLLAALVIFIIGMFGYVKVPTDKVGIISGFRKRFIRGKIGFFLRWFERVDYIDLSVFSVDVNTADFVPTFDYMDVNADAIAKLQIDTKNIEIASQNFLNKSGKQIAEDVKEILEGNLREIIGQMNIQDMIQNRQNFNQKVQENVAPDLEQMGLKVISFTIQTFKDKNNIIESLAQENTSKIKEKASISKAEAEKNIAIATANANKEAMDIKLKTEQEIAEKDTAVQVKKATLKAEADTERAKADATYQLESEKKRLEIEKAKGEADYQREEINIRTRKATLEADIKNQREIEADADLYNRTKDAEAKLVEKQKEMEAIKLQAETEANAVKIKAEAEADAIKLKAEAEALATQRRGEAEAEATRARLLAEAEGKEKMLAAEAEGLNKKAEAMKKYGEGAIMEMYIKALPEIAKNVASPLGNVDRITMYGADGTSNLISSITQGINKISDGISDSTGVDLKSVLAGFLAKGGLDKINSSLNEKEHKNEADKTVIVDENEKPIKKDSQNNKKDR